MLLGLVDSTSNEFFIEFHDTTVTLAIPTSQPFEDLSRWFSFTLDENGRLSKVFYPSEETSEVLAFKKTVVKMLSVGEVERTMEGSKVTLTEGIRENGLTGTKVSSSVLHAACIMYRGL